MEYYGLEKFAKNGQVQSKESPGRLELICCFDESIIINFYPDAYSENSMFNDFVIVESKKKIEIGLVNREETLKNLVEKYKEMPEAELAECYYLNAEACWIVVKSTLYCEKDCYMNMLDELLTIHLKIHNEAPQRVRVGGG
ncbi:hypothetical protein SteCoe_30250 [Stentor coeruleus]|uniref:Uncharacterized protein n=1 Tax=Stentor coeruleus TaxID=5963 RepID=A0A1R2B3Z8_9CILI|nr:hypothetical protein SteCoe_30250 [Stentor coeruleus]